MEALNPPSTSGLPSQGKGSIVSMVPLIQAMGFQVLDPYKGHIKCPGEHLHTQPTSPNHCTLYNNKGILQINCFHQTCCKVVELYNHVLWENARKYAAEKQASTLPRTLPKEELKRLGRPFVGKILKSFPWSCQDIVNDPIGHVTAPVEQHHQLLLSLFNPDDILWIAWDVNQTGQKHNTYNFRSAKEWMNEQECPGQLICPNTFMPNVISRQNNNVSELRFLVVESDELSKDESGAVFRYLMSLGYKLRAIVDTGNKSLHGWFDHPGKQEVLRLKPELTALLCDPKLFSYQQPVRLPGAIRNEGPGKGNHQRLIYFNP